MLTAFILNPYNLASCIFNQLSLHSGKKNLLFLFCFYSLLKNFSLNRSHEGHKYHTKIFSCLSSPLSLCNCCQNVADFKIQLVDGCFDSTKQLRKIWTDSFDPQWAYSLNFILVNKKTMSSQCLDLAFRWLFCTTMILFTVRSNSF